MCKAVVVDVFDDGHCNNSLSFPSLSYLIFKYSSYFLRINERNLAFPGCVNAVVPSQKITSVELGHSTIPDDDDDSSC